MLEVRSGPNCGELTGRMVDQPWGDICDGAEKRKMLLETCAQLGIDFARANVLEVADGRLTGALVPRPWGEVVDGQEKKRVLLEVAELIGAEPAQTIAVGDGANDLPMMGAAGLSIAFHAKPAVRAQAMLAINDGGLDRALSVLLPG